MNIKNFGINLDRYLTENGITRTALAEGIGIEKTHLSKWIYNRTGISLKSYIKIIEWLDIPFEMLLEGEDDRD